MGFDTGELKQLSAQIKRDQRKWELFLEDCAKELAARLLARVVKRTPVDTGTLRKAWTAQASGSGSEDLKTRGVRQYVETLPVHHFGDTYVIEVTNPMEYASYVEFGHRTRDRKGWVEGKFMLTLSEKDIQAKAPKILESKIRRELSRYFND